MTQYTRGYLKELEAIKELQKMGYVPFRSAGSKGAFDVGGIREGEIILIQIKREKEASKRPEQKFRAEIENLGRLPSLGGMMKKEIWIWRDRKGWLKIQINPRKSG